MVTLCVCVFCGGSLYVLCVLFLVLKERTNDNRFVMRFLVRSVH
jgi:hypothetical protein